MIKKRFILSFPVERAGESTTYNLVKYFDIKITILRARITPGKEGKLMLEMEAKEANLLKGLDYLKRNGIGCTPIEKRIEHHAEKCVSCGSCTAVCFSDALYLDKDTKELVFEPEKCVACELCVKACPLQLFKTHFLE
jgi:ferredoxin